MEVEFIILLFAGGIALAIPLIAAGLGETYAGRSGVISIGIEGYMAFGAVTSFATSYLTGNPWLGVIAGVIAGGVLSLIQAYFSITRGFDMIVTGIALLFFGQGLTCLMDWRIFSGLTGRPTVAGFETINIPVLSQVPVIGPILFQHGALTYICFLLVPLLWFILYRTKFGLRVRAVGEFAAASDTMGVNVHGIRYICTVLSGAMSGLAGAVLALEIAKTFFGGMVAGRGFIVIAAVVFGNWSPVRVLGACLLFGLVDAFQIRMQILDWWGIPWPFWAMLPYIATIVVLMAVRRVRVPRELCVPYLREKTE